LKNKRGLQIISGSHSPQKQQQQPIHVLGNKIGKSYSAHGGMSYTKRSTGVKGGGCGCGNKVPKKTGIPTNK
jgi:hypothetical protein